jgi:pyruvate dehydrogenase E1 component
MLIDGFVHQLPDIDPTETTEWLDSLDAVVDAKGKARARYLLARLMERAKEQGVGVPAMVTTDYINTIAPEQEPWFPGDEHVEQRIRAAIRWNAMAMVDRANHRFEGLGGHLSTFASAAALYDVGFNHFFHGKRDGGYGDQVYVQGHAAPGIYARAFLEGRLTEDHLDRFRREVFGGGLPSSGSSRRSRWASARSTRCTRRASTGTCCTASSSTPARRRCGASSVTARWTSPKRPRGCRSPRASSSTT